MATITQGNMFATSNGHAGLGKQTNPNLFHSAYYNPEFYKYIINKYKKYSLTYLLERLGKVSYEQTRHPYINWVESERVRQERTITSAVDNTDGTWNVTLTETVQYFIARDTINLPQDRVGIITEIVATSPAIIIKVAPVDTGAPLVAGNFTAGQKIGHNGNLMEACYTLPTGRKSKGVAYDNYFSKIHDAKEYCDEELYLPLAVGYNGKPYWYYKEQFDQTEEHSKNIELAILNGEKSTGGVTGARSAKGVLQFLFGGSSISTIASTPDEDDLIDQMKIMGLNADVKNWIAFAGTEYMTAITKELKDYHVDGSQFFGNFGVKANTIGLNFETYRFNDKTVTFFTYPVFDDPKIFPTRATGQGTNWSGSAMFLAADKAPHGEDLVSVCYRQGISGKKLKMLYTYSKGHVDAPVGGEGNMRSLDQACFKEDYSTEVTVRMIALNNHGLQVKQ